MKSKPPLRFAKVRLENWRNFVRMQVVLQRRVFLVGPNAAGKSNLLDVFRFLHDIVSVGGGFQDAIRRRGGVSRLRCLAARNPSDVVIAVDVTDAEEATWHYELRFAQDARQRPLVRKERVSRNGSDLLIRPDASDKQDMRSCHASPPWNEKEHPQPSVCDRICP